MLILLICVNHIDESTVRSVVEHANPDRSWHQGTNKLLRAERDDAVQAHRDKPGFDIDPLIASVSVITIATPVVQTRQVTEG